MTYWKKTDFDNRLTSFDKVMTPNKTKYLEVQKKLNTEWVSEFISPS